MDQFLLEALTLGEEWIYLPARGLGLDCEYTAARGSGSAADPCLVTARVVNSEPRAWTGILRLAMGCGGAQEPFFLLPGFMVGTNRGDAPLTVDSKCPRLRPGAPEFPASAWWMTRSDRVSHPVALMFSGERVVGLAGAPVMEQAGGMQFTGFGCDIERRMVYYTLGWENAPYMFTQSHLWHEREITARQTVTLQPGEALNFDFYAFNYSANERAALHDAVKTVYHLFHQPPRSGAPLRKAVSMISTAIHRDAWLEADEAYSGFVFDRGDHYEYRPLNSISWTNGVSAAMPMLLAALRLKNEPMRARALRCIQKIVDGSINPANGLPFTSCQNGQWSNRGWWFDKQPVPGHAAYLVGQTVYSVLKAWEAEKAWAGCCHDDWLSFARNVCASFASSRNSDGEYPYIFSQISPAGLCYDSMSGAWCLAAAAELALLTGDRHELAALLDSEAHYYNAYVKQLCCYGGPLDIDKQIDSEGILAYMRAVRCLHRLTGDQVLLDHLRDAFHFEFTFKFCLNTVISVPPLSRGWSSCGGSITSVTNPHIHPMSSSVIDEMLYYLRFRPDNYILSRVRDTAAWSLQTFNTRDREYDYGRTGWMSERFCYSQGLLTERYADGSPASTWFALMPWAAGCILEGLCGDAWENEALFIL